MNASQKCCLCGSAKDQACPSELSFSEFLVLRSSWTWPYLARPCQNNGMLEFKSVHRRQSLQTTLRAHRAATLRKIIYYMRDLNLGLTPVDHKPHAASASSRIPTEAQDTNNLRDPCSHRLERAETKYHLRFALHGPQRFVTPLEPSSPCNSKRKLVMNPNRIKCHNLATSRVFKTEKRGKEPYAPQGGLLEQLLRSFGGSKANF